MENEYECACQYDVRRHRESVGYGHKPLTDAMCISLAIERNGRAHTLMCCRSTMKGTVKKL